jgi:hypothetical protein
MSDRIDIDRTHSCAISQEIGERLQALLSKQPAAAPSIGKQIEVLRRLEGQSPSTTITARHGVEGGSR